MKKEKKNELLLQSFETDESLEALESEAVTLERSADHVTDGKSSLKAIFDGAGSSIILRVGRAYKSSDWTRYGYLNFDVFNAGEKDVSIEVSFHPVVKISPLAELFDGYEVHTFKIKIPAGTLEQVRIPFQEYTGMRALPLIDGKFHPCGSPVRGPLPGMARFSFLNLASIQSYALMLTQPNETVTLYFDNFRLVPDVSLVGIIDQFGQYTGIDWPGKIHNTRELRERTIAEEKVLDAFRRPLELDKYGGYAKGPKLEATGWFRVEKASGKWWLVTPEGHVFWSVGFNVVNSELRRDATIVKGREYMFKWLPRSDSPYNRFYSPHPTGETERRHNIGPGVERKAKTAFSFYAMNLMRKYGENYQERWMSTTEKRHLYWGINTIGPWADRKVCEAGWAPFVAYISALVKWAGMKRGSGIQRILETEFPEEIDRVIAEETAYWRDNPWLIGYFVGFELPWGRSDFDLPDQCMMEPKASPIKRALVKMLQERYRDDIGRLNKSWGTSFESFDDLYTNPPEKTSSLSDAAAADMREFLRRIAERFFKSVAESLERHDPNHLYLGCRFHSERPAVVFEECAKYADVVSVNIWGNDIKDILHPTLTPMWDLIDKPILILGFTMTAFDQGK